MLTRWRNHAFTGICVLALVLQLTHVVQIATRESSSWPVLYSKDNDGANGVDVLKATQWFNDNQWYVYGPLYYRVSHSLQFFDPFYSNIKTDAPYEQIDRSTHYSALLVSVFSLYALSFLLASILSGVLAVRVMATAVFAGSFLTNYTWSTFLLRVHPDLLLTLLTTAAVWATFKSGVSKEKTKSPYFWLAPILWGFACATKVNLFAFLPITALVLCPPTSKRRLIEGSVFLVLCLASYLIVGYPQTTNIWPTLKWFREYSIHLVPATGDSVRELFEIYFSQIWPPFLSAVLFLLAYGKRNTWPFSSKWIFIPLVPFVYVARYKMIAPHEHYFFPHEGATLALFLLLAGSLIAPISSRLSLTAHKAIRLVAKVACFLLLVQYTLVPKGLSAAFENQNRCRSDAERITGKIRDYMKENRYVLSDSYVPLDRTVPAFRQFSQLDAQHTLSELSHWKGDVFVTSRSFYSRFTPEKVSYYVTSSYSNWPELRKFYKSIEEGKPFKDDAGRLWVREERSSCEWEIWTRKNRS